MAKKIRVPRVPASAYRPDRPASSLLKSHVRLLQEAVLDAIATEGEAAAQISALTATLQQLRPQTQPVSHRDAIKRQQPAQRKRRTTTMRKRR